MNIVAQNWTIFNMLLRTNELSDSGIGGIIGLGLLIAIFMITFLSLKNFSLSRAFVTGGLLTSIIAFLIVPLGLANPFIPYTFLLITIIGYFMLLGERSSEN